MQRPPGERRRKGAFDSAPAAARAWSVRIRCAGFPGPIQGSRLRTELWRKGMEAVGIRVGFEVQEFGENQRAARAGKLQTWDFSSGSASGDGQPMLSYGHSAQVGGWNPAHFRLPALDAIHERMSVLPDAAERDALFTQAEELAVTCMPCKVRWHGITADLVHAQVIGLRRPAFWPDGWHMVDLVPSRG